MAASHRADPPPATTSLHTTAVLLTPATLSAPSHRRRVPATPAPAAAPSLPALSSRRTLPDLDRLSSYTDGAFFDCESPRQSNAMLSLTPSVAEIDYHEAASTTHTPSANGPVKPGQAPPPRDSSRPTHVMVDDIGRLHVDSLSSEAQSGSYSNSGDASQESAVAYGELAQPRAEIILRWKRFLALVLLSAFVLSGVTVFLRTGITVARNVPAAKAESRAELINTYSGVVMGFIESAVGLGFEELLPVFIVYLHNIKWYPRDAPGVKETSKFKKVALTLFIPAFMVAVGSSLSAVQANQKDPSADTTRMRARHLQAADLSPTSTLLEDTVLRSVVSPLAVEIPLLPAQCSPGNDGFTTAAGLVNAVPSVRFGFTPRDWHREVSGTFERLQDDSSHAKVVLNVDSEDDTSVEDIVSMDTARELLLLGSKAVRRATSRRGSRPMRPASSVDIGTIGTVADLFELAASTVGDAGVSVDRDSMQITLERLAVSSLVEFEAVTVRMRQRGVVQVERVCGSDSCVLLEGVNSTRALPTKQIAISPFSGHCEATSDADCTPSDHGAFVFGSTHSIKAEPSTSTQVSSDVDTVSASRSLAFTFGKLSWRYDDFAHECDAPPDGSDECQVLHLQLDSSNKHIVASKEAVLTNLLRRPTTDALIPLVELIQRPVFQPGKQPSTVVGVTASPGQAGRSDDQCMMLVVDTLSHFTLDTRLQLDSSVMTETMAASALFFLLNHGVPTDSAPTVFSAIARHLATSGATVEVYLKNTGAGKVMAWISCGVLFILSLLVVVLPNERARLEPPKGGNARAERFIAVQTEQVYPNLVYKKRFLIGKTGEEIKFRQFVVESASLHHKMDEDEQIFL